MKKKKAGKILDGISYAFYLLAAYLAGLITVGYIIALGGILA